VKQVYIGTDSGATTSKTGAVWSDGNTVSTRLLQRPTNSHLGAQAVIESWVSALEEYLLQNSLTWEQVAGVGLAIPGPYLRYGVLDRTANLPASFEGWDVHTAYSAALAQKAGRAVPLVVGNDGNYGGVAEAQRLRGSSNATVLMLAPGSGLGVAFVDHNGLPLEGSTSEGISSVMLEYYNSFPSLASRMIHAEDGRIDMAAITFVVWTEDDDQAWELYDEMKEITSDLEVLEGVEEVHITGSTILTAVIIRSINDSQVTSLLLTITVSFVVLTIAFFIEERSLFLGGVATLPVVFCVIWIAGTMYITGIPLNVMTITIGALTVGLGITYGIHITHRFIEDERNEKDLLEASKKTILNTGSALFGAALTTVGGFGLLSFATMPPLQQFGQVTALAIIYSFLSSVVVLPVLLILWAKSRRKWRALKQKG